MQRAARRPGKPKKSKAEHRRAAENYARADIGHWIRRTIKAMRQSPRVQSIVASGRLDAFLEPKSK